MSLPRMSLHIGDYKKDTSHLRAAHHGAYFMLIMHYWSKGKLPSDDQQLASIACMTLTEWKKAKPILQEFFAPDWRHKRIDEELAEAKARYERYAEAGRKSGEVRSKNARTRTEHRSKDVHQTFEQPITNNPKEVEHGGGGDARDPVKKPEPLIPPEAHTLADEITIIAGHDPKFPPPQWFGAAMHVSKWLREGWTREIILVAVRSASANKRDGPPDTITYFEKPIAREIARQNAPLPAVKTIEGQSVEIGGGNADHRNSSGGRRGASGNAGNLASIAVQNAILAGET